MDPIDYQILDLLQRDARTTQVQIAQAVGLSQPSVADRIRKLDASGSILGYVARLDPRALGNDIRSEGPIRAELRSTAHDMIVLLDAMAHDKLIDPWSSREMLDILGGQHHNTLLPVPLPPGTAIVVDSAAA